MIHLDKLGAEIIAGDYVCGSYNSFRQDVAIFKVLECTRKMLKLKNLEAKKKNSHFRYANFTIKLTAEQVNPLLFLILKNK